MFDNGKLERMMELIKIANVNEDDILNDFIEYIFDKIDCDDCPMKSKCEYRKYVDEHGGNDTNYHGKNCWILIGDYIYQGAGA